MMRSRSAGESARTDDSSGAASFMIEDNTAIAVSPVNGRTPAAISYMTTPSENTSDRASIVRAIALLRRHVGRCCNHLMRRGDLGRGLQPCRRRPAGIVLQLGDAEVEHFDLTAWTDHDVGRLRIPMDDPVRVRGADRVRERNRPCEEVAPGHTSRADGLGQCPPLDQLHVRKWRPPASSTE
jgi:hypothetical protein